MAWAFDSSMGSFGLLAWIDEAIAAKARCKLIAVVAANAIVRGGKSLQRREGQRMVALACLIAELRPGEPEDVNNFPDVFQPHRDVVTDRRFPGEKPYRVNKAVHLGAKVSDAHALEILTICSEIGIPVYKVTLASNDFRMISLPTSLND